MTSTPPTPGCPRWTELRKTGKDLITSQQLAKDGKPTLDLGAVSDEFAGAHPEMVDVWRQQEARALELIHDDPAAAAKAIAAEIGLSPEDVTGQLKQGVYLTPAEVASTEWLGSEGKPGNIAANLQSASQFLADQKQIPSAASLQTFPGRHLHQGPAECPHSVMSKPKSRNATTPRSGSAGCHTATAMAATRSPRSALST